MTTDERYRSILGKHLAMNQLSWKALLAHGVTPRSLLRLDFAYDAPGLQAAHALEALLKDQTDYDVRVEASEIKTVGGWRVTGSTQPTELSLDILDEWVDWMITAGLAHESEFDGWGAQI